MSKTPLLDFLVKATKDPDYSQKFYDKVMGVFKDEGLNENHARILISGDKRLYEAEVSKELAFAGEQRRMVGDRPSNHGPMCMWPGYEKPE